MSSEINALIGTPAAWQTLEAQGCPEISPVSQGVCQVTFWWRDPHGDERHSPVRHVWLVVTGITDHHGSPHPVSLVRVPGTDAWTLTLTLDAHWRGSYCLVPDIHVFPADIVGDRRQWQSLLTGAIADPLNPFSWSGGRGHPVSGLSLPFAPPQPAWDAAELSFPEPWCFSWRSARLGNVRRVWVCETGEGGAQRPLAMLLDGQFWAQSMPIFPVLHRLTREGVLPPAVYVLVDAIDTTWRSAELPCNPTFWQAVQDDLLPQVARRAAFSSDPARTVVAGQSFGGLSALYAGLTWPARIGAVLSLSGSFWWPSREAGGMTGQLLTQLETGALTARGLRIYLEAGRHEPIIATANARLCRILAGHPALKFSEVEGGHDALCWRGGIIAGLAWLWQSGPG